jgi:hypothetical protein
MADSNKIIINKVEEKKVSQKGNEGRKKEKK